MLDVAKAAGVSAQTVSRVANHSAEVRPDTRERVERAMEQLGYRPNYAARALKRGHFRNIGVALFDMTQYGNAHNLGAVADAARARGYAVTICGFDPAEPVTLQDIAARMKSLPVDGVIVGLERQVADLDTFVPTDELPMVLIAEGPAAHCPTVDADQYGCSVTLVDYLLDRGHRTVYHIAGPAHSLGAASRVDGWRAALEARGRRVPSLYFGDWSADSGYQAGLALAHEDDCTAVYAANDQMAYGAILGLREAGKRVPEDVSVVGVDDSLVGIVPRLELTTMRVRFDEIGSTAVDMVLRSLEGESVPVGTKHVVSDELVERGSVRALGD
ncbi:MAG: LacI family DNA-binding transcriptional regulator [Bifidobacterium sp.]|nr:LacI family DNA-binding transcriptional regulator [Bifidobacterium sp.]